MLWTHWAASVPKFGNDPSENEDSFAVDETPEGVLRAVVADGATESYRSRDWAARLTEAFIESQGSAIETKRWLPNVQAAFNDSLSMSELPWHAQIKAARGAHASLIGLELNLAGASFRVLHIGDCCMITSGSRPRFFPKPFSHPGRFNNNPNLVGSRSPFLPYPHKTAIRELRSDERVIWLMSDAIARYALEATAFNLVDTFRLLETVDSQDRLALIVEQARNERTIANDDVTLLRICLEDEG